ncbi:hypothetical protein JVU11DRAFT_8143 [Chiua virens]|nr:hypothetical protein JVU11DRAFT_8143 [Chiua virens]
MAGSMFSAGDFQGITRCPSEILLSIFHFLTATDVHHLRQVSKRFHDLSCDIGLWRSLYANACVPRPPGPFLWQTYDMLQGILLRSEQLDRTWTSQPCKAVRMSDPFHLDWIRDGICFTLFRVDRLWFARAKCELDYELVCYDFKTGSQSILWKWDRPFLVNVCLDMSAEGPTVFLLAMDKVSKTHA